MSRNDELMKMIGREIHDKRFKQLVMAEIIAEQLDISFDDVENMEKGKFGHVKFDSLCRLLLYFEIDIKGAGSKLNE